MNYETMDYATMDWEAEAKRVAAAFKVEHLCRFYESEFGVYTLKLDGPYDSIYTGYPRIDEAELSVEYSDHYRYFSLELARNNFIGFDVIEINLSWEGGIKRAVKRATHTGQCSKQMAEALFCLGLLTPEIEQVLEVTVTGHEKMRLALEFDSRFPSSTSEN